MGTQSEFHLPLLLHNLQDFGSITDGLERLEPAAATTATAAGAEVPRLVENCSSSAPLSWGAPYKKSDSPPLISCLPQHFPSKKPKCSDKAFSGEQTALCLLRCCQAAPEREITLKMCIVLITLAEVQEHKLGQR